MKTSAPTQRSCICARTLLLCLCVIPITNVSMRAQNSPMRVETFSLKPNGEVVVENPRGATRIETWDFKTVRVVAEKKGADSSSIEPGELVLMSAQNSVMVQCRQGIGRIDISIYLPHNAQLQVTGGVWPVDISGALSAAVVDTTSGNIGYRLPPNDDARIAMRSSAGTVHSTMQLKAAERTGTHSLNGQIGSGTSQLILSSLSGNINLTPGLPMSAVARASKADAALQAITQASQSAASVASERDSQSSVQQSGGITSSKGVDQVSRDDINPNDPGANNRTSRSTSSIDFAGSDRSEDSTSTSTRGPFTRPRTERKTGGGNSGLNVRIIPSNTSPRTSRNTAGTVFDQASNDDDATQSSTGSGSGKPQSSPSTGGASNPSAGGSMDIGGTDRSDAGSSKSKVGRLERDHETKSMSGGNSGMRVRIIPAGSPTGSPAGSKQGASRSASSVFDQRDDGPDSTSDGSAGQTTNQRGSGQTSKPYDEPQGTSGRVVNSAPRNDEEIASNNPRTAPPVLNRSRADESSRALENTNETVAKNPDEEAIVLKAALVSLNVSVTNRAGVALPNLKAEDFAIAENGEAQKIAFFQPTTAPFNLVLLLDLSGSIKDKLEVVKSAALRFIDILGPQDKVAVVTFTDEIRVVSQLTSDREELKRRIKTVDRSQGGTAFYEAVWFSLMDTLRGTRGQRNAIVVMTDGVDSSLDRYNPMQSRVSFNQLAHRLEESDVLVFPIYLDTEYEEVFERGNSSSEAYAVARDQLDRIAEVTGAQAFKAEKVGDLSGVYKQVAAAIRTVYSVGYYPTNAERDGTFRRVRVAVNRADAAVRTRKGYFAK